MVIKRINIIKCPHCNSTNKTQFTEGFYHCNQCRHNYYSDLSNNDGLLVKSSKTSLTRSGQPTNRGGLFIKLVVGLFIIYTVIIIVNIINDHYLADSEDTVTSHPPDEFVRGMPEGPLFDSGFSTKDVTSTTIEPYPRTAYVFFQDESTHQNYLFKASFLTQNNDENDANVVNVKNEAGKFVGYDQLSGKVIPNFTQLIKEPLSLDAAILYVDKGSLIIKNKVAESYQLELIDSYTGQVIWTLSDKELSGLDTLTGKYSSVENKGIELFRNNFRIKLPPNYYVVDKKGQIIGFGKIN